MLQDLHLVLVGDYIARYRRIWHGLHRLKEERLSTCRPPEDQPQRSKQCCKHVLSNCFQVYSST